MMITKLCPKCQPGHVEQKSKYYGPGPCDSCGEAGVLIGFAVRALLERIELVERFRLIPTGNYSRARLDLYLAGRIDLNELLAHQTPADAPDAAEIADHLSVAKTLAISARSALPDSTAVEGEQRVLVNIARGQLNAAISHLFQALGESLANERKSSAQTDEPTPETERNT